MSEEEQPKEGQHRRKRQAVIVGINKYKNYPTIPELTGAENDAEDIYDRLSKPDIGNFEIPDDHCLIGEDATCERIRKAISDIFWKTDTHDIALFYFSGHGFEDGYGNGYIAPYDMVKDEPFVYGINLQELKHVFSKSTNKVNIIILDSCYSGILTKGEVSMPDNFLEDLGEGRFILTSSAGDQVSREISLKHEIEQEPHELHSHGAFTFYLIEGMNSKAADEHGRVFLNKLYNYSEEQLYVIGKQKSKLGMTDASGFSTIEIAVIPEIYIKKIETKINDAEECYLNFRNNNDPSSLIHAVENIHSVLDINKENKSACELKDKYSDALTSHYQDAAIDWLAHNQDVSHQISNVFPKIGKLVVNLDFDKITKINHQNTQLLILLCRVSTGVIDTNQFITYCKPFNKEAKERGVSVPPSPLYSPGTLSQPSIPSPSRTPKRDMATFMKGGFHDG